MGKLLFYNFKMSKLMDQSIQISMKAEKTFLISLLGIGMIWIFTGCDMFNGDCSCKDYGGIASEITNNHGHELFVPSGDFENPTDGIYSIKGDADHDHQVSFTGQELMIVSDNNSKTVNSTAGGTDNHIHVVTLDCNCDQ